jgi:hypothetical protein
MSNKQYFLLLLMAVVLGATLGIYWPTIAQEPQIKPDNPIAESDETTASRDFKPISRKLFARNVVFDYQPDSPLEVVSVEDTNDGKSEQIKITLKNINAKAVRAFTLVTKGYASLNTPPTRGSLSNIALGNNGVGPNGITVMYLTMNHFDNPEMYINVDFIEFADGTTWGEDKSKFHEYLLGFREGFLALTEKLIEQLETKNAAAGILQEIGRSAQRNSMPFENSNLGIVENKAAHPQWQNGFWNGVDRAKFALKKLNNEKDLTAKLYESRYLMQALGAGQNDTK